MLIPAGNAGLGGRHGSLVGPLVIPAQGLLLGRRAAAKPTEQVLALSHPQASAEHAFVRQAGGAYALADNSSTNGTFLNGQRLVHVTPLTGGDLIFVGGEGFVFRFASDQELQAVSDEIAQPLGPVPTRNPTFARLLRRLRVLAEGDNELLLIGETGVGKEVYARAIHDHSKRQGPFVAINCAAIPSELVESELFGFVRGAHSQAKESKAGLIADAHGGTLLLDEIGDMPATAQVKLLRFVQTKELWPIGATSGRRVDVRIVAATSHLVSQTNTPGVREDLIARLGANPPLLPPLCDRREDLGALISYFMAGEAKPIEPAAFRCLLTYTWPRNVRELQAVIKEALVFSQAEPTVTLEHLPPFIAQAAACQTSPPPAGSMVVAPTERVRRLPRALPSKEELEQLLEHFGGNLAHVARHIEHEWKVVKRAVDRHGIDLSRFRT